MKPPWLRRHPRGKRFRRLQARLLLWFLGAIIFAIAASAVTTFLTSSDPGETPTRVFSRHVQQRVQRLWDDPAATEAYVAELRETTGLDIRVRRDPSIFHGGRRVRPGGIVFEDGVAYVPVSRRGVPVGALELHTGAQSPPLWRVIVALGAALLVLGAAARRVSVRLARPLEQVAVTAERFGSGDLSARTKIDEMPRRWVAEEVREVGRAFDTMADRVGKVVLEQRELLAAISHELRSPLGRARVALEIARERSEGTGAERSLGDVDRQLVEIDAILGDLLASARAGLADLRRETVELVSWLQERVGVEQAGPVDVVAEGSARSLAVEMDPALFGRALHNVLANAWNHGHPKELPLVIVVARASDRVRITVRDRGPGFRADILARAFDAFVTGTGTARSPGAGHGIGLGLALVRRIVEAHGGTASARNIAEADRILGAEVILELPVLER